MVYFKSLISISNTGTFSLIDPSIRVFVLQGMTTMGYLREIKSIRRFAITGDINA